MDRKTFRDKVSGVTLGWTWLGVSRTVEGETKEEVNELLGTDGTSISLSKKILNTKNPLLRELNRLKNEAESFYRNHTLPYLQKGVRLTARERYSSLRDAFRGADGFRDKIKLAEAELEKNRLSVIEEAREILGEKLFNESDYPASFAGLFDLTFEPVNIEPASYLMELAPEDYERQLKALEERIEQSFAVCEDQLAEQFSKLIEHLLDRLKPAEDGSKKRITGASVDNLFEFFAKFQDMRSQMSGARDMSTLSEIIEKAKVTIQDFDADGLRASEKVRNKVSAAFEEIRGELERKVTTASRRKVILKKPETPATEAVA